MLCCGGCHARHAALMMSVALHVCILLRERSPDVILDAPKVKPSEAGADVDGVWVCARFFSYRGVFK